PQHLLLRRHHRDRRLLIRRGYGLRRAAFVGARDRGPHDLLFDLRGIARRTGNQILLPLLVEILGRAEPAFEAVSGFARQRVTNHDALPTRCSRAPSFDGATTSNRRPCSSAGILRRASATCAKSISAIVTPGSMPASAITRP